MTIFRIKFSGNTVPYRIGVSALNSASCVRGVVGALLNYIIEPYLNFAPWVCTVILSSDDVSLNYLIDLGEKSSKRAEKTSIRNHGILAQNRYSSFTDIEF